jgi:hypothetical protein
VKVCCPDAIEVTTGRLRCANRREFGDEFVFRGLLESGELVSVRVCQMLKVERTGYSVLEITHLSDRKVSSGHHL